MRRSDLIRVVGLSAALLSGWWIYDLRITIYEAFGVVEGFGSGYVFGLSSCLLRVIQLSGWRVCGLVRIERLQQFDMVRHAHQPSSVQGLKDLIATSTWSALVNNEDRTLKESNCE